MTCKCCYPALLRPLVDNHSKALSSEIHCSTINVQSTQHTWNLDYTLIKFSINSATRPITHKSKIIISTLITLLTFQWDLSGLSPAILWTTHSIWCSSTSVICINLETTRFNLVRRLNTKNYKVTSASFRHALLPTDLTASWCGNGFVSISTLITPLEVGRNKFQP